MRNIYNGTGYARSVIKRRLQVCFSILIFLLILQSAKAQVTVTEGFETTLFPPAGWSLGKVYGLTAVDFMRVAVGVNPAAAPQSGTALVSYNSFNITSGGSFLASKQLDFSSRPACNAAGTVRLWMFRDAGFAGDFDSLRVYINNTPDLNGAPVLLSGPSPSPILRPCAAPPVAVCGTWNQYTYNIPAGRCSNSEFIIFYCGSSFGNNIHLDNIQIDTWPTAQTFNSTTLTNQNSTTVGRGNLNQQIVGANVVMNFAGNPPLSLDSISFNTNGSTNLADMQNAKLWYTSGSNQFGTGVQYAATIVNPSLTSPFPGNLTFKMANVPSGTLVVGQQYIVGGGPGCSITHNAVIYNNGQLFTAANANYTITTNPTGRCTAMNYFPLDIGNNYFWVTYDVPAGATLGNCLDAEYAGAYVAETGVLNAATTVTLPGCRVIEVSYCGGVTPIYIVGTAFFNYTFNDYINHVTLWGEGFTSPGVPIIDNALNSTGPNIPPWFGGPAPFSVHPPDYELFPAVPGKTCVLKQGTVYAMPPANFAGPGLTLQCGAFPVLNFMNAFIDFNHDGDFADVGEAIATNPLPALNGFATMNLAVNVPLAGPPSVGAAGPATSAVGNTIMRVREVFANSAIDPCQSPAVFGEIEDYVITIIPNCNPIIKTWLGYTDDWSVANNWCGGVPTINDVALVQFSASGTPVAGYHKPAIHTGVTATAQTIRLAAGDTIFVDAVNNASLTVKDSLHINYAGTGNGDIRITSSYVNTARISNGTLNFNFTPFAATRKNQRMQIVYTAADFAGQGLLVGDVVDELQFNIVSRATNPAFAGIYNGFTISYAYCTAPWNSWTPPPGALATAGGYTVVYTGNLNMNAPVVAGGLGAPAATGTLRIPLTTPFVYLGGDLVLNFCYNNSIVPTASVLANDLIQQTVTTNLYQVMWINNNNTSAVNFGCALNWPLPVGNVAAVSQFRPNIIFKFHRVFNKFPITIGTSAGVVNGVPVLTPSTGHWINNNNGALITDGFQAGWSNVTFGSSAANQDITGIKSTLFNDLSVNKPSGTVTQRMPVTVDSNLVLTSGPLLLNSLVLTANHGNAAAVSRTNGYLVSEDPAAAGQLAWKIGTFAGAHNFPFGTASGTYIPVSVTPAADHGTVSIATYTTIPANTPYPTPATHVNNLAGSPNNGTLTVDRFWVLNKTGPAASSANIILSYDNNEANVPNTINKSALVAQRWVGMGWSIGIGSSAVGGTVSSQSMFGVTNNFNGPWALSDITNPLPIELLQFTATLIQDKVKIWWKTASERDNNYFTVERTTDYQEFSFIDQLSSKGSSSKEQDYETYDYHPLHGLQYYRLKTTGTDGDESYSRFVPVVVNADSHFTINMVSGTSESGSITVGFTYNSDQPCQYVISDLLGRELLSKENAGAHEGENTLTIPASLASGTYLITLRNRDESICRKFVY